MPTAGSASRPRPNAPVPALPVDLDAFGRAFFALFVIIDPVGDVLVFHILAAHLSRRQRAATIGIAVTAAAVMLGLFAVGGSGLLEVVGVSPGSFRVAAGLLLLPTVYSLVVEGELPQTSRNAELDPLQLGLVPLATPLLAGPGALASVVTFSRTLGANETLLATGAVLAVSALVFAASGVVFRLLGPALLRLLTRVVGLVVFAIATEFVLSGINQALR